VKPSFTQESLTMKTDSQLQQDVIAELKWQPSVNAEEIGVEVKDGVVTLAGHLSNYLAKYNAEEATLRVSGVKALAVEMEVRLPSFSERTDADIARAAKNALDWLTTPMSDKVKVMVEQGCITLTGDVDWQYQKISAEVAVRHLLGVTGVANLIAIKPAVKLSAVQSDIETALVRRAKADAKKIHAAVHGSQITLSGKVDNWAERDTARDTAWGTPGVTHVIDSMTMEF
jgi:osmotically-inducible protein OsmY